MCIRDRPQCRQGRCTATIHAVRLGPTVGSYAVRTGYRLGPCCSTERAGRPTLMPARTSAEGERGGHGDSLGLRLLDPHFVGLVLETPLALPPLRTPIPRVRTAQSADASERN
eukprot:394524-Rhodomonas_salina.4